MNTERLNWALEIMGAKKIKYVFSQTEKMPGLSFSLPASKCLRGSKLIEKKESTCSHCYAFRGRYIFTTVKDAQKRRWEMLMLHLDSGEWEEAFKICFSFKSCLHFRWHDSGDLQSVNHLRAICNIAEYFPHTFFWLPTKQKEMVKKVMEEREIPKNLVIRVSSFMTGQKPFDFPNTHTEHTIPGKPVAGIECESYLNGNQCGSCRNCWNPEIQNISFKKH